MSRSCRARARCSRVRRRTRGGVFTRWGEREGLPSEYVWALAEDWLNRHGAEDNWFLHVHMWDPHTPYRAAASYGEPFADDPLPAKGRHGSAQVDAPEWAQLATPEYLNYRKVSIYGGSSEVQRQIIDKAVLGL